MKKSDLKKIIKPMVAECIKESLLEDGILSTVINEVVKGMSAQLVIESSQHAHAAPQQDPVHNEDLAKNREIGTQKLDETKRKMLTAIGQGAYNGVNIFEGTTPAPRGAPPGGQATSNGPLKDTDPNDPGVDISGLLNSNWSKLV
tara:strand:- start:794 stop:1228 length:435 start_codon:yes stop_codon:yes gene_type:complete